MIRPGYILERFRSDQAALQSFVDELHSRSPNFELRSLIGRHISDWFKLGRVTNRLFSKYPDLEKISIQTYVRGTNSPHAEAIYTPYTESSEPMIKAQIRFLNFLLNPHNEYFGGPCRKCNRYFIGKTRRRKRVYCSQACGRTVSSRQATKQKRELVRTELVKKIEEEIAGMDFSPDWKRRIVKRCPEITLHIITRALNAGEIKAPQEKH